MVLRLEVGQARKKSAKGPPGLETARALGKKKGGIRLNEAENCHRQ